MSCLRYTSIKNDFITLHRFLPGHKNYTLIINMDANNVQSVRLSNKISNLSESLTVVVGSANSNFDTGLVHNICGKINSEYFTMKDCCSLIKYQSNIL